MNDPVKRKNCRGRERKEKGRKARTTERRNDEKKKLKYDGKNGIATEIT